MNQILEEFNSKTIIAILILTICLVGTVAYFAGNQEGYRKGYEVGYTTGYNKGLDNNYVRAASKKIAQQRNPRSIIERIIKREQRASLKESLNELISNSSKLFLNK